MKIFAISLPRFKERYEHLQKHLSTFSGLNFSFIGVDGSNEIITSRRSTSTFLPGAIGCTLSHIEAYKCIEAENLHCALIIEDDAVLPKNIIQILAKISIKIKSNEIISLYSRTIGTAKYSSRHAERLESARLLYPMEAKWVRSTAAYVIGRDAAINIARGNDPIRFLADDFKNFYNEKWIDSIRLMHPMPVTLRAFESTIEQGQGTGFKNIFRTAVRNIKFFDYFRKIRRQNILNQQEEDLIVIDKVSPIATGFLGK